MLLINLVCNKLLLSQLIVSPGIYPSASMVSGLSRRGDAGRSGTDPDVSTTRADPAKAQGCRFRRHFVSHTHFTRTYAISPQNLASNGWALFPPRRLSRPPRSGISERVPASRKRLSAYLIIILHNSDINV